MPDSSKFITWKSKAQLVQEARYWREAYETLILQTGRDLNDGLGLDPRKTQPARR